MSDRQKLHLSDSLLMLMLEAASEDAAAIETMAMIRVASMLAKAPASNVVKFPK